VTWGVDFTTNARADLVGLEPEISEAVTEALVSWTQGGPPRENRRQLGGIVFYEATVAGRYLVGYTVREEPQSFVVLWLRRKPGVLT